MRVCRIAHAGLIVEAGGLRCLMDPVLVQPFESGTNMFEPPVAIHAEQAARGPYDLLILSHEHGDHFCVESLAMLHRSIPVLFPAGCALIPRALAGLGFRVLRPVVPGSHVVFGPLDLAFTPSDVTFPEMGVLFGHRGLRFWNCVDSVLDERAFAMLPRAPRARLDLMFGQYQCLIEQALGVDALGAGFPLKHHAKNLADAARADPRCFVPSSCGYRYASEQWQNGRGFPISEEEFLADLALVAPAVRGTILPPGAAIDLETLAVDYQALPFVRRLPQRQDTLAWRPDRPVPALADDDPCSHGTAALRARISRLLATWVLDELALPCHDEWRTRMAAAKLLWQLEIVYPDGAREQRWLDFSGDTRHWLAAPSRPPKMVTAITASSLAGLASGETVPYRAIFTRRVVVKLYATSRRGVDRAGGVADEPVARLLFPNANRRHVDWQLARLGYRPPPPAAAGISGVARLPRRW